MPSCCCWLLLLLLLRATAAAGTCGPGLLSLNGGGSSCCPQNRTCPKGRAMDGDRCVCAPFGCFEPDEVLVVEPRTHEVRCTSSRWNARVQECGGACALPQHALDLVTCACLASGCGEGQTEQRWRTSDGFFVCVPFF